MSNSRRISACERLVVPGMIGSRWERLKLFRRYKMPRILIKQTQIMIIAAIRGVPTTNPDIQRLKRQYTPELWLADVETSGNA
jgi:hypothetical protein